MIDYLDTSAYLKLFVEEAESRTLSADVESRRTAGHRFVSSMLLVTEMHRAAHRLGIPRDVIDDELSKLTLVSVVDETFRRAGTFPDPALRSLDALHLATAIECGAQTLLTYDHRQAAAAAAAGITVHSPSPRRSTS